MTGCAVDRDELLQRVRAARRALAMGHVEMAYTLVAAIEHALAYDVDTLQILMVDQFVESAAALPRTGVQTAEEALATVVRASLTSKSGPPAFTLIVRGEVEGATTAELFTSTEADCGEDRVFAWLTVGDL